MTSRRLALPCSLLVILPALLHAAGDRFPKPDFEGPYRYPEQHWPGAGPAWLDGVDIALLAVALLAAAHLVLRLRSRRGVAVLGLLCLGYFGFWRQGCLCAVGAIQPMTEALAGSSAISMVGVAFFALPLLAALLFGRVFCAAVCPLGLIQDVVAVRPQRLSPRLAAALGMLPVVYLAAAVLLAATGTAYAICRLDPFVAFFRFSGHAHGVLTGGALLLLGVVLARPYCRFLCPYGVLLGWCSRLARRHATITPDTCISCRLCAESCPYDAIRGPVAAKPSEPVPRGMRRLAAILVAAPLILLLAGWCASRLAVPLAGMHEEVRLSDQFRLEAAGQSEPTVESVAFRRSERTVEDLHAAATGRRDALRRGGWLAGVFVGLVLVLRLAAASMHRTAEDFEPDRGACLSCARCFRTCPKEHARLRQLGRSA